MSARGPGRSMHYPSISRPGPFALCNLREQAGVRARRWGSASRPRPRRECWSSARGASGLVAVLSLACARETPTPAADTVTFARPVITRTPVNDGTYGMSAQVRWAFSADRRAVIVVVDPVAVEAEPVPDGFFFGVEDPAFSVQVDTVWDVAPAPNWRAVAFSKAYVLSNGEAPVPDERWTQLARTTGIDAATLRTSSFPASGMASYVFGVAQPGVIRVPAEPRSPRMYAVPRGWRVRWTADGSMIALGANPSGSQDDSPSTGWSTLDPNSGQVSGSLPTSARLAETRWTTGPDLYYGMQIQLNAAPPIQVRRGETNYTIESQRGVITLRDPAFTTASLPIGPGVALAATAGGRYIIALSPRAATREFELPVEVVVYEVAF